MCVCVCVCVCDLGCLFNRSGDNIHTHERRDTAHSNPMKIRTTTNCCILTHTSHNPTCLYTLTKKNNHTHRHETRTHTDHGTVFFSFDLLSVVWRFHFCARIEFAYARVVNDSKGKHTYTHPRNSGPVSGTGPHFAAAPIRHTHTHAHIHGVEIGPRTNRHMHGTATKFRLSTQGTHTNEHEREYQPRLFFTHAQRYGASSQTPSAQPIGMCGDLMVCRTQKRQCMSELL